MKMKFKDRRESVRRECKVFVIVCEGETEKIYFNNYRKRKCNLIIRIPNNMKTDPLNLVKFAKSQIRRFDLDLENGDKIWCIFDADKNTNNQILKAIKDAGKDIQIIMSNPSFELWYFLHFSYIDNKIDNKTLIRLLNKDIPNYKKKMDYFNLLVDKRNNAIKNAKKLNEFHKKSGVELNSSLSNPSTQIYKIVENILEITNCSMEKEKENG